MKRPLNFFGEDVYMMANGTKNEIRFGETEDIDGICSPEEDLGRPLSTDYRPILFGMLNVSGLAGQAHLPERIMMEHDLDFLFLSETWTGPGGCRRLCPWTIHSQEQDIKSNGRHHYGQCLIANQAKIGLDRVEVITEDPSGDKSFVVVKVEGILFICCYFKPNEGVDWLCSKLSLLEDHLATDQPVVIIGDLNARHTEMGDHYSNAYGNTLLGFIDAMNLQRVEPGKGRWTFIRGLNRSVIDHVIGNEAAVERGLDCIIHEELYVGATEHRLVTGRITG
jgi:Endonuclease-reverse transcriptase